MFRLVLVASLLTSLTACRISLEDEGDDDTGGGMRCKVSTTSQDCLDAVNHMDYKFLEAKVFNLSCGFSGCHNGANDVAGRTDLRTGQAYSHLINQSSMLEPSRKLVVPGDVNASYLMLMLGAISPAEANPPGQAPENGYMPKDAPSLCCQKLDAVERWIAAGAQNN